MGCLGSQESRVSGHSRRSPGSPGSASSILTGDTTTTGLANSSRFLPLAPKAPNGGTWKDRICSVCSAAPRASRSPLGVSGTPPVSTGSRRPSPGRALPSIALRLCSLVRLDSKAGKKRRVCFGCRNFLLGMFAGKLGSYLAFSCRKPVLSLSASGPGQANRDRPP